MGSGNEGGRRRATKAGQSIRAERHLTWKKDDSAPTTAAAGHLAAGARLMIARPERLSLASGRFRARLSPINISHASERASAERQSRRLHVAAGRGTARAESQLEKAEGD